MSECVFSFSWNALNKHPVRYVLVNVVPINRQKVGINNSTKNTNPLPSLFPFLSLSPSSSFLSSYILCLVPFKQRDIFGFYSSSLCCPIRLHNSNFQTQTIVCLSECSGQLGADAALCSRRSSRANVASRRRCQLHVPDSPGEFQHSQIDA